MNTQGLFVSHFAKGDCTTTNPEAVGQALRQPRAADSFAPLLTFCKFQKLSPFPLPFQSAAIHFDPEDSFSLSLMTEWNASFVPQAFKKIC